MKKRYINLLFVSSIATTAILTLACSLSSLSLFTSNKSGLQHLERAEDGQVSGSFIYPREEGKETVKFFVSKEGLAGFWLEGASEDEILAVDIRQKEFAQMSWKGVQIDGFGTLSAEEKTALDDLELSDLAYGLSMIPLDIACQEEGLVDSAQMAALLFPLQMRFKYQITDRIETASILGSLSQCNYRDNEEDVNKVNATIIMMPSSPVPVVFGYFPFDAEGASEVPITTSSDVKLASLNVSLLANEIDYTSKIKLPGITQFDYEATRDEWGPCKSKCRGACGSDCTTNNCKLTVEDRCEKNQDGQNDGFKSIVYVYDCGLHPGCIKHDKCYDDCNSYYGCGTFAAAFCMHAETFVSAPFEYFSESYLSCDSEVVIEDGIVNSVDWMRGYGPQTSREIFEYTDPEYRYEYDPVSCPLGEITEDEEPVIQQEDEQESPNSAEEKIPAGTYTGVPTFYTLLENDVDNSYLPPICGQNTIRVVIGSDGSTQGEITSICYSNMEPEGESSGMTYHSEVTGLIEGDIQGNSGEVSIVYTWRTYFTSPQWETTSLDQTTEFIFPYHLNVVGNVMTLIPAADVEEFYSFTLNKD